VKVFLQSTLDVPADWAEHDSTAWASLPKKAEPRGGETIDDVVGWCHGLNVQGVCFQADHYHVRDIPDGLRVTVWYDDPTLAPKTRYARVWDILFSASDITLGGAINTRQSEIIYAESVKFAQLNASGPVENSVLREWSLFIPPTSNIMHGKEVDDSLHERHLVVRSIHGWREWTEGLDPSEIENEKVKQQRSQGRFSPAKGTRTYFQRNADEDTDVHTAPHELALETSTTSVTEVQVSLVQEETKLGFVFTTLSVEPNTLAWPTGDYRCQLDCATAGTNIVYGLLQVNAGASGHFSRVNAGLTSDLETKTQSEGQFSGTGLKLATTGSVSWTSGAAADRFECAIAAKNTNTMHGTETLGLDVNTTDSFADGPWVVGVLGPVAAANYRFRRTP